MSQKHRLSAEVSNKNLVTSLWDAVDFFYVFILHMIAWLGGTVIITAPHSWAEDASGGEKSAHPPLVNVSNDYNVHTDTVSEADV